MDSHLISFALIYKKCIVILILLMTAQALYVGVYNSNYIILKDEAVILT